MGVATFRVDPAAVCRRARGLVQDGRHMYAARVLGDAYVGMDLATTFSILDGTMTLEADGAGGARLVEDGCHEAAEHREFLAANHGHKVRIDGRWHEPYAYVLDVTKDDWRMRVEGLSPAARERAWKAWAATIEATLGTEPERTGANEGQAFAPLHYADDPSSERLAYLRVGYYFDGGIRPYTVMREMGCPVFFRPCEAPPPWMRGAATLMQATERAIEGLHATMRGHRVDTGQIDRMSFAPDYARREQARPRMDRELAEARARAERDDGRTEAARRAERVIDEPVHPLHLASVRNEMPSIRERILAQAAASGGFVEIDLGEGPVPVPRAPFERWALRPLRMEHLAPDWVPVSPPDLKLQNDSRDHSDWMIGAGLDPFGWHGHGEDRRRLREAGYAAMHALQDERGKVRHAVLAGSGAVSGPVWIARRGELPPLGAVVVLPDASPSWLPAVQAAIGAHAGVGAVIVEQGGAMAHLVTVLREGGAPVIRWPGAREALAQAGEVRVDCSDGTVEVMAYEVTVPEDLVPGEDDSPLPGM